MDRLEGTDFRLPTEAELDALEAFQASLGRQTEIDLATMNFANPDVQAGKDLFNGVGINRACSACHNNAGANNAAGFNRNFNTNTADLGHEARQPTRPPGTAASAASRLGPPVARFGDGTFNTTPVIEAADTPPFFHNNSAQTIEDAVRFYTTPTFSADNPFALNADPDQPGRSVAARDQCSGEHPQQQRSSRGRRSASCSRRSRRSRSGSSPTPRTRSRC